MSATHSPIPLRTIAPVVRIADRPLVSREPQPVRIVPRDQFDGCLDGFDACLEAGMCCFPGRCSQNRAA